MDNLQSRITARAVADQDFRTRLLADPRAAIVEELGISIPPSISGVVHENAGNTAHLVLPALHLNEEELALTAAGQGDDYEEDPCADYSVDR